MTFTIGQRWISNTESQLGLGIITDLQGRQVGISFPAAGEERIYAIDNAPLSRIIYKEGEEIITNDQNKITVTHVTEHQGLVLYTGTDETGNESQVKELALNCFIKLSTPEQRLFSGLLDKLNSFKLRIETLNHTSRLQLSPVRGLLGSRTSHLPHQVYIASEVAQRYAPRVLLADEVGLGKTIEAGMILHYQLHTGRANRILIVVPDTLIHQWLVEMIRRFNLYFSIFDQSRYDAIHGTKAEYDDDEENSELVETRSEENLFDTEQLVLCSLDFLMANENARLQATASSWDILVVDEAHHLHWSEKNKSPEYSCIEQLAEQSKGLLLLTATPEQVGIQSHFARLRLLDPSRFYDFSVFKKEEEHYREINKVVQKLVEYRNETQTDELNSELRSELSPYLGDQTASNINETIRILLDRHGTGRVLFRNTRSAIQGFPDRHVQFYPLPKTTIYSSPSEQSGVINLFPEAALDITWIENDPRVEWLVNQLHHLFPKKVLVICAKAKTAIALEQYLKVKKAFRSTAFHEGLTIVDRDRAAAYFAEEENGAQTLVCSEIGSEGRNFQFSHHLVLFDLPLNPDLLEQRIGRLDRIGQRHTIEIHVPYLLDTAQELLLRWYHEGINLFEKSCSVGFSIFEAFEDRLLPLLEKAMDEETGQAALDALIDDTKAYTEHISQELQAGRDKLLEMNSCDLPKAKELIAAIEAEENCLELENYMTKVFHEYAIEHEYHSEYAEVLRPTEHMKTSHFPGLKQDGMTVTYSRTKALVREDMEFLSWEHPMVSESMEMILDSEVGNATLATISVKTIMPGTLFLETFYTVNCAAPKELQLDRFLPLTPIRILMDVTGKNLSKILSYTQLNEMCEPVKRHLGYPIVKQVHHDLEKILDKSNETAEEQMREMIHRAHSEMKGSISHEVRRLEGLQKVNPAIREEEIMFLKKQIVDSEHYLNSATLKLQAIRVVINK
ncbi:RNA polymerase-associated protein RapA [Legionella antarctica]|uniref:RNA polymerase-associated protein RapA n=1 Tax=Legionella antarctica TaxID=2708020 RepID=A0A6F8T278_9GAMM|nr:RNA polymerase-associated protein RapA [Legionella antarctica]BCA94571.1 RNA polymerase-associated protein RapA [Legionella antarctica]